MQIVEYQVIVYLDHYDGDSLELREHLDDLAFELGGGCMVLSSTPKRFLFLMPSLRSAASLRYKIRMELRKQATVEIRGAYKRKNRR